MASRTNFVRKVCGSYLHGASLRRAQSARAGSELLRGFCSSIKVNNIPQWATAYKDHGTLPITLPYKDCTILTVLDSVDMAGRADCRQGKCRKCAVNVRTDAAGEVYEVLSCQEIATDGLLVDLPDGWQPKPRWSDPHPEKLRVTTRELKATDKSNSSAALGKKLKTLVEKGNYALKREKWEACMKAMDDIDDIIGRFGFSRYIEFARCTTLTRDLVPDFFVSLRLSIKVNSFPNVPQELADKAGDLADIIKEHLEEAGTSAAAFDADMDENTIGSHGVGKKGAQTEGSDGGANALESGAFYRNFSIWPELYDSGKPDGPPLIESVGGGRDGAMHIGGGRM